MKKYKGLIFDFNGVLIQDQHLHDEVFQVISREIRRRGLTEEEFNNQVYGRNNKLIFEYLFGRRLEPKELEQWATKKEMGYQNLARSEGPKYRLSTGAVQLLEELRSHNILYTIGTSSPTMNIAFFNEMLGLDRWFDMGKIICDDGTLRGKPAPDIYLKAARALALPPEECVVIEDAHSGIASARNAHIGYIIAIGPKESHETLRRLEGVNEVIETLNEVDVQRLFGV